MFCEFSVHADIMDSHHSSGCFSHHNKQLNKLTFRFAFFISFSILVASITLLQPTQSYKVRKRSKTLEIQSLYKFSHLHHLANLDHFVGLGLTSIHGGTQARRKRRRLIRSDPQVVSVIEKGLRMVIDECKRQFKDRRWNCPTFDTRKHGVFGKIVGRGYRETAYLHAITSAALTHAVANACKEGILGTCSCEHRHSPHTAAEIALGWQGCSDNIEFGYKFARDFVDVAEVGRDLRFAVNIHNNEAGRLSVKNHMRTACKCHGMSGSCTMKTCWKKLPSFHDVGSYLKDRFDGASKVITANDGRGFIPEVASVKKPTSEDLVYTQESPNFCEPDPSIGFFGTRGRECNATSRGVNGCDLLCCGRGHKTIKTSEQVNCRCRFIWCCEVVCDKCVVKKKVSICK